MPQIAVAAVFQVAGWAATTLGASTTVSLAVANAAVATAKVALMAGINKAIAHQNKPEPQGRMVNIAVSPDEPRRLMIGKRMTGGVLSDWYVRGSKNQNLYFVIYLGEGPMGRITKLQAGGRTVYLNPINHGVRTVVPNFRSGGERLWVTYFDGRPGQVADSNLVSKGLGWTGACKGTGMAYAVVEMQWDSDNLTSPVQLSFELEGAKLYDRRKDSTAGGAGSHRLTDPATWELSSNPAVACDHYMLGRYRNGVKTFGVGIDPDDVPFDRFAALANLCDEDVPVSAGGVHPRYECNGFLFADRTYKDTILDLCRAMNARPADFGGRIGILDGQTRAPVLALDSADMLEDAQEQYVPKRSWASLVSGVEGRFVPASQNYQPVDFARVSDASWTSMDGGQPKWATLDLEMETNHERAQRLAWLYAKRERRQAQLTGIYPLWAIELEQGDWFTRTGGKFGSGKVFEVLTRTLDPKSMNVTITAFEVDPSDSAWDNTVASGFVADPVEGTGTLPPLPAPSFSATPDGLSAADGSTIPGVGLSIVYDADTILVETQIEVVRDDGNGAPDSSSEVFTRTVPAGRTVQWFAGELLPGTDYVYRGRSVLGEQHGDWSSWQQFTTSGVFVSQSAYSAAPGGMLASTLAGLQVQADGNQSLIFTESAARAAADSASAVQITTVEARIASGIMGGIRDASNFALGFTDTAFWKDSISQVSYDTLELPSSQITETVHGPAWTRTSYDYLALGTPLNVEPGQKLRFKLRYFVSQNSTNGDPAVALRTYRFSDANTYQGHALIAVTPPVTVADGLQEREYEYTVPSSCKRLWPYLYVNHQHKNATMHLLSFELLRLDYVPSAASVNVLQEAFVDGNTGEAFARINLVAEASGSDPAEIEIISGDGGAQIILSGNTLIKGNLILEGSILNARGFAAQALTQGKSEETDADLTVTSNWADAESASITVEENEEVDVMWSMAVAGTGTATSNTTGGFMYMRLIRGVDVIYSETTIGYMPGSNEAVRMTPSGGGSMVLYDRDAPVNIYNHPSGMDFDQPPAGTHTYKLQVKSTGGSWKASKRRLRLVRRKA